MTVIINGSNTPTAGTVAVGDGTTINFTAAGTAGQVLTSNGAGVPTWTTNGAGTVTSASVVSANGFAGTVANASTTPEITLTTSITGVIKGNGTALSAATAGTDYLIPPSGTALLKANSGGALANAVAGTDYVAPSGALGTPSSGTLSGCTVDGTNSVGFRTIPQNTQYTNYTLVLADSGKHIFHDLGEAAATYTIPANSSVSFPVGTAITFINMAASVVSIAITTDTLRLSSAGTTGTRSLAQYGSATAIKVSLTVWLISGSGLT